MSKTVEAIATFQKRESERLYDSDLFFDGNLRFADYNRCCDANCRSYISVYLSTRTTKGKSAHRRNNQKCFEEISLIL
jgi:hypothetical protein